MGGKLTKIKLVKNKISKCCYHEKCIKRRMTNEKTKYKDSGPSLANYQYELAPLTIVHHFIPPNLPMLPIHTTAYVGDCNKTWKYILGSATDRLREYKKPGIVLFYDEFFYRLFQRDASFKEVFPNTKRRGEILIRAMTMMLKSSTENNNQLVNKIRYLGHRHRYYPKIRPYQFSTYTSTAIEVVMFWLAEYATPDIAEAWSNVVCFFMKHMIEAFLNDKIDPHEYYQNTGVTTSMRQLNESTSSRSEIQQKGRSSSVSSSQELIKCR